jgi:hypothetical protein
MVRPRRQGTKKAPEAGEKPVSKLSDIPPLTHDPDDRPRREDLEGHGSPFDIPVPLPRFLQPRGRRKKPSDQMPLRDRVRARRDAKRTRSLERQQARATELRHRDEHTGGYGDPPL